VTKDSATRERAGLQRRLHRLKLRQITCVLEIARTGSVRRTAESLSLTESAISKTLGELEAELGVSLFERTNRGMSLTEVGRRFASYASNALDALQAGVALAGGNGSADTAVLRLGAMSVVTATFLPEVVRCFLSYYPAGLVDITPGLGATLLSRLRDGLVDLVLGRLPPTTDMGALSFEELYSDRYVFLVRAGHPLAGRKRPALAQLTACPIITPPRQTEVWREIHDHLEAIGLHPGPRIEVIDVHFSRTFALRSDAIWIGSERAAANDLEAGVLRRLPLAPPGAPARIGILTRRSQYRPPQLQMVMDIVREASARYERVGASAAQG